MVGKIKIGASEVDDSGLQKPSSGKIFRDAWSLNGSVIDIDLEKAKKLRMVQLLDEIDETCNRLAYEAKRDLASSDLAAYQNKISKIETLKKGPSDVGLSKIFNSNSPEALEAITIEDITE